MGNLRRWSSSASGNSSVAGGANTINFAEGQAPGSVNNSAREMMAQVRGIYTPSEWGWVEFSATASVASQTTIKLTGNQTSDWTAGRRWRLKSGSSTRYGSIVSSSFTAETTITVSVDSGSLSASHSLAALAAIDSNHVPTNNYITSNSASAMVASQISNATIGTSQIAANAVDGTKIALGSDAQGDVMYYDGTNWVRLAAGTSGQFLKTNGAAANPVWASETTNSVTLLGTLTTTSLGAQSLTGQTLTNYKFLKFVFNAVSVNSTGGNISVGAGVVMGGNVGSNIWYGFVDLDLGTGLQVATLAIGVGVAETSRITNSGYSTATTTITVSTPTGAFDAGSITVYGVA